jgi:hypothetical protein
MFSQIMFGTSDTVVMIVNFFDLDEVTYKKHRWGE